MSIVTPATSPLHTNPTEARTRRRARAAAAPRGSIAPEHRVNIVDTEELSIDVTLDDVHNDEGRPSIKVWVGGSTAGVVYGNPADLVRLAKDLETAARRAAQVLADMRGENWISMSGWEASGWNASGGTAPRDSEFSLVEWTRGDGSSYLHAMPFPISRPEIGHWHPADIAAKGEWWTIPSDEVDIPRSTVKGRFLARVRVAEEFDDMWVEVQATPLADYPATAKRPKPAGIRAAA